MNKWSCSGMEYKQLKLSLKTAYQSILGYIPNTYPFHPCIFFFRMDKIHVFIYPVQISHNVSRLFLSIFHPAQPATAKKTMGTPPVVGMEKTTKLHPAESAARVEGFGLMRCRSTGFSQHLKSVKRLGEDFGRWMIMGFSWILIGEDWWGIYWELHGLMIWWDSMGHDVIVNQWVLLQGLQQTSPVFQVYTCLYLLDCPGCNML